MRPTSIWLNSKRISRTICLLEWAPACLQGFPWWDANVPTLNYVDISTIANISIQTTTNIKTFPWWEDNGLVLNCDDISTIKMCFFLCSIQSTNNLWWHSKLFCRIVLFLCAFCLFLVSLVPNMSLHCRKFLYFHLSKSCSSVSNKHPLPGGLDDTNMGDGIWVQSAIFW